ncbi:MAG: hypothetical protein HKN76_19240 [Saprospiraceae bacterium]|nr:hypothetical protein [Saprospiraceae bacterium]
MTSVPNLQLPLSGSKLCCLFFVAVLGMAGCGIFGPAAKKETDPDSDVAKTPSERVSEVDTITFVENSEEEFPPITERETTKVTEHKSIYNIVLLAPFSAKRMQREGDFASARMIRMIEYLAGIEYGLESCISGIDIQLNVIDTDNDVEFKPTFSEMPALIEADIIIGPYFTERVEAISSFALEQQKVIVSPWNTSKLSTANPYYIQMRPSLKTHALKIDQFVTSRSSLDQIMLMTKNDPRDIETLTFFQGNIPAGPDGRKRELIIDDIGNPDLTDSLSLYVSEQGYRDFIVPVWQDEAFVIAALSKLNFAQGEEKITVYGLPQWMEMSRMDYDYFENLSVHLSSARPARYVSQDSKSFTHSYYQKYGDLPGDDAYYGLNTIKWLAELLKVNGTDITSDLGIEVPDLDQRFELTAIFGDDGESIHHYENQFINILRFSEYRFEEVD